MRTGLIWFGFGFSGDDKRRDANSRRGEERSEKDVCRRGKVEMTRSGECREGVVEESEGQERKAEYEKSKSQRHALIVSWVEKH